jgi:cation diffusion facilitator CzcD-associated flavoprotein CzcO
MIDNGTRDELLAAAVIGGSQAGLAMAWHLARQQLRFEVLEAAPEIGHTWRSRWDSLTLFTPTQYDALPGMPFPGPADTYPTKDPVADYLTAYAAAFNLPVKLDTRVTQLRKTADGFEIHTRDEIFRARQVVVATGPFQVPWTPPAAQQLDGSVTQLHSAGYRNPQSLPPGPALVVGGGNSGFQIAEELAAAGREVSLSIAIKAPMLPQRLAGRDLFWWLTRLGLMRVTTKSRLGRRLSSRPDFVIGSSRRRLAAAGGPVPARCGRRGGAHGPVHRRHLAERWHCRLGDRLPLRLLLDRYSRRDPQRPGGPQAGGHRCSRFVLRGPDLATHSRLGSARLRQRRRRLPCQAHRPQRPGQPARHPPCVPAVWVSWLKNSPQQRPDARAGPDEVAGSASGQAVLPKAATAEGSLKGAT